MNIFLYTVLALLMGIALGSFMLRKEKGITQKQRWTAITMIAIQLAVASCILAVINEAFDIPMLLDFGITVVVCLGVALIAIPAVYKYIAKVRK